MTETDLATRIRGLVLRPLSEADAQAYYALIDRNRDHLTRYGDYQEMREATDLSIAKELAGTNEQLRFGIWLGDALVGRADLVPRESGNFVLGYWLDHENTGRGFATAACGALIDHGRSTLGATDVWAGVTKGNTASERVLDRLGFERVGDMGGYTRFHRFLRN